MHETRLSEETSDTIKTALDDAERKGFRLAVIGRTVAILTIALTSLWGYYFPVNIAVSALTATIACIGLMSLMAVGTRYERQARFALFAFDATIISALIAFAPLSSGDAIPQNLVFMTSRVQNYYIVVASAILTLSPIVVIWTGAWSVGGLIWATLWIMSGMDNYLTFGDLPPGPSRDDYFNTVLNPDFLGTASRGMEALILSAVTAIAALAVRRARTVVQDHAHAEAGRVRVQNLFGRYVPAPVVRELIYQGHLTPQMRQATLLFADIEGFTRLAENTPPEKLVNLLNELFSQVSAIIDRNGGVVINYIGDAIIASFNAPLPAEDHAARAIEASRAILAMVAAQQFEGFTISLRIGIATGAVAAGTVGGGERQTYTLYGDAVNLAQRLEALNKELSTKCLICETTARQANGARDRLTSLGVVSIRNRELPTEVFTLPMTSRTALRGASRPD